ncbi:serine O-acetyltransferase [Paenibacillus sp. GD4]|jgi:serine O-acetyltransferase|uniref:serine O-acetyltransferase n=1 Tax=Paenibacillus sp. GD4 TaxID=3068890 RepID=UPI002796CEBC|nr:serine O-acetyltransferase [Paenibacillus sp. GD4]MDQ1910398.1 serine O-acetyltransferase [Paenibacillus sp. GD4]
MTFGHLRELIAADLYRYEGKVNRKLLLANLRSTPGFQYTFWMRVCRYFGEARPHILNKTLFFAARQMLKHYRYKLTIDIPFGTEIGKGFYISHFGGIFINPEAKLGRNVNVSQGVTIGQASRGERAGCPVIGDHVYIGPGAKLIGAIRVGDYAAIGANCVVTKDVPSHGVVVGIPGKVISLCGSAGYILNDCDELRRQVGGG